jgi:hypothetical protein
MSHHKSIFIDGVKCGHARITNDGVILSIWIDTEVQRMLMIPEDKEVVEQIVGEKI